MSTYIESYESKTLRFDDIFAYVTLTDFGPGQGLVQLYTDYGSYSSFWGAMGKDRSIAKFLADCSAEYIHGNFMQSQNYQSMKQEAKVRLDRFMINCWPDIHAKLKELAAIEQTPKESK